MKTINKKVSDFAFNNAFKRLYKNIYNSYNCIEYYKDVDIDGGRAGGKSHGVAEENIFNLPNVRYHETLYVCYSNKHKINTCTLLEEKLMQHGYIIDVGYKKKTLSDGTIKIYFGNNNIINLISISSKSKEQMVDRIKNTFFENSKYFPIGQGSLKFVVMEEFTATLVEFGNVFDCINALSSFNRDCVENPVWFYIYNPPRNKRHKIFEWKKVMHNMLTIKTTIYDLPEKYQSKHDMELAERIRVLDEKSWKHIYMGIPTGDDGLAFQMSESIWRDPTKYKYKQFLIQTDEATANATTFALHGITTNNELHYITNFYHSSKVDGIRKSKSTYAMHFLKWYEENNISTQEIYTDGVDFVEELKKVGFHGAKSINNIKDRPLSYTILNNLILDGKFGIAAYKENMMMYDQCCNAELEYDRHGRPMVYKGHESGDKNEKHTHALDTSLYICLVLQKDLIAMTGIDYGRLN